jgi:DNA topoisomerase-1
MLSPTSPDEELRQAGLRYASDARPGITREGQAGGFRYRDPGGRLIRDRATLERIRRIVIPPAWKDVWISPDPRAHLQATGRDARGRKQYRYHARWREVRDEAKYDRILDFARALPRIRRRYRRDLARPSLNRERILAAATALLDSTLIRIGNQEYARANGSFGLTTLRDRHVDVRGERLRFQFRGKSGRIHAITLADARLARVVRRLQELPGQELLRYVDEQGQLHGVDSADVNAYLREASGGDFTAKDFRTWAGTVLAAAALRGMEAAESETARRRNVRDAVVEVAARLGNTPAVCRRCYIHPEVLNAYLEAPRAGTGSSRAKVRVVGDRQGSAGALRPEEAAALALLRRRLRSPRAPVIAHPGE